MFIFLWEHEVVGVYIPLRWLVNMRWLVFIFLGELFIFLWEHEVVGVYIPLGT